MSAKKQDQEFPEGLQPGGVRVLQVTDTHLLADPSDTLLGMATEHSLSKVLDQASTEGRTDLIIATGDLVHDHSLAAYERLRDRLKAFGCPVYALSGNHDDPGLMQQAFASHDSIHLCRRAVTDHWVLIYLDSRIDGEDGGYLAESELDALDETLSAEPDRHALVCLHHQPVPVRSRWIDTMALANADAFFAVIDRHPQVRGIVWGHVHQTFDEWRGKVRLLATPSTCFQFTPGSETFAVDNEAPGYRWLGLNPDGSLVTTVTRLANVPRELKLQSSGY